MVPLGENGRFTCRIRTDSPNSIGWHVIEPGSNSSFNLSPNKTFDYATSIGHRMPCNTLDDSCFEYFMELTLKGELKANNSLVQCVSDINGRIHRVPDPRVSSRFFVYGK